MEKNIYLAGIGGQGLQAVGKTIAEAANQLGYNVTYSPKYGAQKRGGLTSCYIVISDETIGNPRKNKQDLLLVMEPKAYKNFHKNIRPNGVLVVNSTLIDEKDDPVAGTYRIDVPLHQCCKELGNTKVISSVTLGALSVLLRDIFSDEKQLLDIMLETLKGKEQLIELNKKAFYMGCEKMNSAQQTAMC